MKIILFGSNGQVGSFLKNKLKKLGEVKACTRDDCDLEKPEQIKKVIAEYKPDLIVNAAAYTNVDKAESDQVKTKLINATSQLAMAEEARKLDAILISYSTDYVFDGAKNSPYIETDKTNPISIYGKTKLLGEEYIKKSGCKYLILRTSWAYSPGGHNFINTIIRLAKEKESLTVVNDQIGSPTSAEFIADATIKCIEKGIDKENSGIYHLTSKGAISWHEFATYIIKFLTNQGVKFTLKAENIKAVPSSEYKTPAARPKYSVLDSSLIEKTFDIEIASWDHYVDKNLKQYK
jgi:dTDP-4-dehydrorhamnose reductase